MHNYNQNNFGHTQFLLVIDAQCIASVCMVSSTDITVVTHISFCLAFSKLLAKK